MWARSRGACPRCSEAPRLDTQTLGTGSAGRPRWRRTSRRGRRRRRSSLRRARARGGARARQPERLALGRSRGADREGPRPSRAGAGACRAGGPCCGRACSLLTQVALKSGAGPGTQSGASSGQRMEGQGSGMQPPSAHTLPWGQAAASPHSALRQAAGREGPGMCRRHAVQAPLPSQPV